MVMMMLALFTVNQLVSLNPTFDALSLSKEEDEMDPPEPPPVAHKAPSSRPSRLALISAFVGLDHP